MTHPLRALAAASPCIWLDDLHRRLIDSGVRSFVAPYEAFERWIELGGGVGAPQIAAKCA